MTENEQKVVFERWLKQHKGILLKIVRSFAFDDEDRKDLFQEIAIKVWGSIPKYREAASPSTWIYRVSLYAAIAWSKSQKKCSDKTRSFDEIENYLSIEDTHISPQLRWLHEQISQLEEVERSLVILILDGNSYRETGEILGISESNVGVKFNRIKKKLIEKIRKEEKNGL